MAVGEFCWNELLTSDEAGATKFYSAIFGWETAAFPGADVKYTIWKQQGKGLGGLMKRPMEAIPPHWLSPLIRKSAHVFLVKPLRPTPSFLVWLIWLGVGSGRCG